MVIFSRHRHKTDRNKQHIQFPKFQYINSDITGKIINITKIHNRKYIN